MSTCSICAELENKERRSNPPDYISRAVAGVDKADTQQHAPGASLGPSPRTVSNESCLEPLWGPRLIGRRKLFITQSWGENGTSGGRSHTRSCICHVSYADSVICFLYLPLTLSHHPPRRTTTAFCASGCRLQYVAGVGAAEKTFLSVQL